MIAEKTLLLDAGYSPISIISWTRAIGLMWLGKVEVLEEYDREVHSPSIAVRLPAVVRLISRIVRPGDEYVSPGRISTCVITVNASIAAVK